MSAVFFVSTGGNPMTHSIASIQPDGEIRISGSTTANEAHVRAAISRLNPNTRGQVYVALADDGAGISDLVMRIK